MTKLKRPGKRYIPRVNDSGASAISRGSCKRRFNEIFLGSSQRGFNEISRGSTEWAGITRPESITRPYIF
ncbi:hypothetical protein [Microseira wollei]|uniref:hypothetical protein n=1 Tax=Microseira wollei TaxID=467598 RepID=UPI001CFC8F18|nr:hypothetical protein [Microseira wollei]